MTCELAVGGCLLGGDKVRSCRKGSGLCCVLLLGNSQAGPGSS